MYSGDYAVGLVVILEVRYTLDWEIDHLASTSLASEDMHEVASAVAVD